MLNAPFLTQSDRVPTVPEHIYINNNIIILITIYYNLI